MAASVVVSVERKRPGREADFDLAGLSDFSGHWCMEWKGVLPPRGTGQGDLWLEVQTRRGLWARRWVECAGEKYVSMQGSYAGRGDIAMLCL